MRRKIITHYEFQAIVRRDLIARRDLDWCAYRAGEPENGDYGFGATEAEAIEDLRWRGGERATTPSELMHRLRNRQIENGE